MMVEVMMDIYTVCPQFNIIGKNSPECEYLTSINRVAISWKCFREGHVNKWFLIICFLTGAGEEKNN